MSSRTHRQHRTAALLLLLAASVLALHTVVAQGTTKSVVDVSVGWAPDYADEILFLRLDDGQWVRLCRTVISELQATLLCRVAGYREPARNTLGYPLIAAPRTYLGMTPKDGSGSSTPIEFGTETFPPITAAMICSASNQSCSANVTLSGLRDQCASSQLVSLQCSGSLDLLLPLPSNVSYTPSALDYFRRNFNTSSDATPYNPCARDSADSQVWFGLTQLDLVVSDDIDTCRSASSTNCPYAETRWAIIPAFAGYTVQFEMRVTTPNSRCVLDRPVVLDSTTEVLLSMTLSSNSSSGTSTQEYSQLASLSSKASTPASSRISSSWSSFSFNVAPVPYARTVTFRWTQKPIVGHDDPNLWLMRNIRVQPLPTLLFFTPGIILQPSAVNVGVRYCSSHIINYFLTLSPEDCLSVCSSTSQCRSALTSTATSNSSAAKLGLCIISRARVSEAQLFCDKTAMVLPNTPLFTYENPLACPLFIAPSFMPCANGSPGSSCALACQPGLEPVDSGSITWALCDHSTLTWTIIGASMPTCVPSASQVISMAAVHLDDHTFNSGVVAIVTSSDQPDGQPVCANGWSNESSAVVCRTIGFAQPSASAVLMMAGLAPSWVATTLGARVGHSMYYEQFSCEGHEQNLGYCPYEPVDYNCQSYSLIPSTGRGPTSTVTTVSTIATMPDTDAADVTCFGTLTETFDAPGTGIIAEIGGTGGQCVISNDDKLYFGGNSIRYVSTRSFEIPARVPSAVVFDYWVADADICNPPKSGAEVLFAYKLDSNSVASTWTVQQSVTPVAGQRGWVTFTVKLPSFATSQSIQFQWRQRSHGGFGMDVWGLDNVRLELPSTSIADYFYSYPASPSSQVCQDWLLPLADKTRSYFDIASSSTECLTLCASMRDCMSIVAAFNGVADMTACFPLKVDFAAETLRCSSASLPLQTTSQQHTLVAYVLSTRCTAISSCHTTRQGGLCNSPAHGELVCNAQLMWQSTTTGAIVTDDGSVASQPSSSRSSFPVFGIVLVAVGVFLAGLVTYLTLLVRRHHKQAAIRLPLTQQELANGSMPFLGSLPSPAFDAYGPPGSSPALASDVGENLSHTSFTRGDGEFACNDLDDHEVVEPTSTMPSANVSMLTVGATARSTSSLHRPIPDSVHRFLEYLEREEALDGADVDILQADDVSNEDMDQSQSSTLRAAPVVLIVNDMAILPDLNERLHMNMPPTAKLTSANLQTLLRPQHHTSSSRGLAALPRLSATTNTAYDTRPSLRASSEFASAAHPSTDYVSTKPGTSLARSTLSVVQHEEEFSEV